MNFKKLGGIRCHHRDDITLADTKFGQGTSKTRAALVDLFPSVVARAINQCFVVRVDVFDAIKKT